ncbi:putative metal-binding protein [Mycobacteroides chelonae]|nr:putative metal-binding protein [Mycobacteroides chelonae]
MKFGKRVAMDLAIAAVAAALAVWAAVAARVPTEVAPVAKGEPTLYFTTLDGACVARALALTAVAGIFLVLAIARGVRDRRATHPMHS